MRILLTLESLKDYAYDRQYHHKLQGFVFSLLRHSEYAHLHDLPGWKPLCFSNIFPMTENAAGARKHLLLSSPHPGVAEALLGQAEALAGKDIHIGEMSFRLTGARLLSPRLERYPVFTKNDVAKPVNRGRPTCGQSFTGTHAAYCAVCATGPARQQQHPDSWNDGGATETEAISP